MEGDKPLFPLGVILGWGPLEASFSPPCSLRCRTSLGCSWVSRDNRHCCWFWKESSSPCYGGVGALGRQYLAGSRTAFCRECHGRGAGFMRSDGYARFSGLPAPPLVQYTAGRARHWPADAGMRIIPFRMEGKKKKSKKDTGA